MESTFANWRSAMVGLGLTVAVVGRTCDCIHVARDRHRSDRAASAAKAPLMSNQAAASSNEHPNPP